MAVQQWQGLIAVNYAARHHGVKRFDSIESSLQVRGKPFLSSSS